MNQENLQQAFLFHQNGEFEIAEKIYRQFLDANPGHIDANYLLGTLLLQRDDKGAEALLQSVIEQVPNHWHAIYNLGLAYLRKNQGAKAVDLLYQACHLNSSHAEGFLNLGFAALLTKDYPLLMDALRESLKLNPLLEAARHVLVVSSLDAGRFVTAMMHVLEWAALTPDVDVVQPLLAQSLAKGRLFKAADSNFPSEITGLGENALIAAGTARHYQSKLDEANAAYRAAMLINPSNVQAHFNRSLLLLVNGSFEEGWREFDWRFAPGGAVRKFETTVPEWDGSALQGETVLVHSEQGFGDVIQFMRFFPEIEARGARILFTSYPDVIQLLAGQAKAESREDADTFDFSYQYQIPLLTLGKLFAQNEEMIRASSRIYIDSPIQKKERWREQIASYPGFKVGLAWAGNPDHINDQIRSMALNDLAPLADVPAVTYFSLQIGTFSGQAHLPPLGMNVVDLSGEIEDFTDTAAIISSLNLVICVDSSVAHLAGALGAPVWLLLPHNNDWRWLLNRDDSPWYKTMKLWRQKSEREGWTQVVARVRDGLVDLIDERARNNDLDNVAAVAWEARCNVLADDTDFAFRELFASTFIGKMPDAWVASLIQLLGKQSLPFEVVSWLSHRPYWHGRISEAVEEYEVALEAYSKVSHSDRLWRSAQWDACALLWAKKNFAELENVVNALREKDPEEHAWFYWQSQVARMQERYEDAIEGYQNFIKVFRRSAEARVNLGLCYWKLGNDSLALEQFERAVMCNSRHETAWYYLAWYLHETNRLEASFLVLNEIVDWFPDNAKLRLWRSNLLHRLGRYGESLQDALIAKRMCPDLEGIEFRLAVAEAATSFENAPEVMIKHLNEHPTDMGMHLNWALDLLARGCYEAGWAAYEHRLNQPNCDSVKRRLPHFQLPRWDGAPLAGRRILVFCEYGFGDTLNFLRFIHRLSGGEVTLAVQDGLLELLEGANLPCRLIQRSSLSEHGRFSSVDFDVYIEMMSLPHFLGVGPNVGLRQGEMLVPNFHELPSLVNLDQFRQLKVGVVWGGNPKHANTHLRDCPLRNWLPLFNLRGIDWISLQKDTPSNQILFLKDPVPITNVAASCQSWQETAAVVQQLDLIITVDTAIAHLAGAMGKSVWLLLSSETDWRWGHSGENSDWYPHVRLFRQEVLNDWTGVVQRVENALEEVLKNDK